MIQLVCTGDFERKNTLKIFYVSNIIQFREKSQKGRGSS